MELQMPAMRADTLTIEECQDSDLMPLVDFFVSSVDNDYVSHSELKYGAATPDGNWISGLGEHVRKRFLSFLDHQGGDSAYEIAVAKFDSQIVGMAIIEIEKPSLHPASLTLHDIVVGRGSRGQGVGRQLFDWVSARCESERIDRIFLESGIRNTQAHAIFENLGFRKTAVMMMKEIALRP